MHEHLVPNGNVVAAQQRLDIPDHLDELKVDPCQWAGLDQERVLVERVRIGAPLFPGSWENRHEQGNVQFPGHLIGVGSLRQALCLPVVNLEVIGRRTGVVRLDEEVRAMAGNHRVGDKQVVGKVESLRGTGSDLQQCVRREIERDFVGVRCLHLRWLAGHLGAGLYGLTEVVRLSAHYPRFDDRFLAEPVLPRIGPPIAGLQGQEIVAVCGDLMAQQHRFGCHAIGMLVPHPDQTDTLGEPQISCSVDEGTGRWRVGMRVGDDGLVLQRLGERAGRSCRRLVAVEGHHRLGVPFIHSGFDRALKGVELQHPRRGAEQIGGQHIHRHRLG